MALATTVKSWLKGLFGTHAQFPVSTVDVNTDVDRIYRRSKSFYHASAENAATNVATTYIGYVHTNVRIIAARYIPGGSLTANAANYAVLRVLSGNGGAAATTVIANVATTATNMAAGVAYTLDVVSANELIAGGSTLAFNIGKVGTGQDVPAGSVEVILEEV